MNRNGIYILASSVTLDRANCVMPHPETWAVVTYFGLVALGIVFSLLSRQNPRTMPSRRNSKLYRVFRNKHSVTIIFTLWGAGVAIGMAAYSPPIPKEFFDI